MSQFGEHMHTEHCDINLFKDKLQFFRGPSRITISIIIPLALRNFFMFSKNNEIGMIIPILQIKINHCLRSQSQFGASVLSWAQVWLVLLDPCPWPLLVRTGFLALAQAGEPMLSKVRNLASETMSSETKLSHLILSLLVLLILLLLRERLHQRGGTECVSEPWECFTHRMIKTWNTRRALLIAFGDRKVVHMTV